jgi:hypothetical protein
MTGKRWWQLATTGSVLVVIATVLAFTFDFKKYVRHPWAVPATPPPRARLVASETSDFSTADFIAAMLLTKTQKHRLLEGSRLRIATLFSREDEPTAMYVLEGTLNKAKLDPSASWAQLTGPLMIVNSVDRHKSGRGGIGENVAIGCAVKSVDELKVMAEGDERIDPCRGDYAQEGHIAWVADMAIYTSGRYRRIYHCSSAAYRESACLREAVDSGFGQLFTKGLPRIEKSGLAGVLIPAIGTSRPRGNPSLSKDEFYEALANAIYAALDKKYPLPRSIYFMVWSKDATP